VAAIPGRDGSGTQRETGPATESREVSHVTEADGARSVLFVLLALTVLTGVVEK
jgi:hypothetical protein